MPDEDVRPTLVRSRRVAAVAASGLRRIAMHKRASELVALRAHATGRN